MSVKLTISARPFAMLGEYARARHLDFHALARRAGLEPGFAGQPDATVSCTAVAALLDDLAATARDDAFIIDYVAALPPRPSGVYQTIVFNSQTLRDAFCAMARYLALVTDAFSMAYGEHGGNGQLTFDFPHELLGRKQFVAGQLGIIANRARQLLGPACTPERVEFMLPEPAKLEKWKTIFGSNIQFDGSANRIAYAIRHLRQPLPSADQQLREQINEFGLNLLEERNRQSAIAVRVAQFVAGALQRGEATELHACRALNIGRRTLQRELAAASTSFRQILEDERKRLARHYLIETGLSLTAIALLLGYSELSAFSRASRAWFGVAPSMVRQQQSGGRGATVAMRKSRE